MTIAVERRNVGPRLVMNEVADGIRECAEGVEFHASCGCVCIFGVRLDNGEKTCAYGPCDRHKPQSAEFMRRLLDPEGQEIPTEAWMAHILDGLDS
jgi:hypothetical protein